MWFEPEDKEEKNEKYDNPPVCGGIGLYQLLFPDESGDKRASDCGPRRYVGKDYCNGGNHAGSSDSNFAYAWTL